MNPNTATMNGVILTVSVILLLENCHCISAALTKKDRSRVSAEDILTHEDPRSAVLVKIVLYVCTLSQKQNKKVDTLLFFHQERVQVKSAQAASL